MVIKKGFTHVDAYFRTIPSGKIVSVTDHFRNLSYYQMKLGNKIYSNIDKWRLEKLKEFHNVPNLRYRFLQMLRENLLGENQQEYEGNEWYLNLSSNYPNFLIDVQDPSDLLIFNLKSDAYYSLGNLSNDKIIEVMKDLNMMR